jgi:Tol biopolymer transport system component
MRRRAEFDGEPPDADGCTSNVTDPRLRAGSLAVMCLLAVGCGAPNELPSRSPALAPAATTTAASAYPTLAAVASPPTAAPLRLSLSSGRPIDPAELSGTIAFSYDDGIWTAAADGSNRTQVTQDGGFDPTLSPDGKTIVYRLLLATDDGEIWRVGADGRDRRNLVQDPAFSDWGPAYSPDGGLVAFDSNRSGGLALWLMRADGTDQHRIGGGHGEYPAWSPDGTQLVYAGGSYYDIRIVSADGAGDRALTSSPAYDMGPAWSPDGAWIAYHTQADQYPDLVEAGMGDEMEIHLVRPDGSDDHRITDDDVEDSFPAWSPDGRFLMSSRHGELVVARPDGSGQVAIGPGNFPSWVP